MRARLLIVVVCLAGLWTPAVEAAPPLADHMPANSIAYVGWAGRNLPFDGSMLGQMLQQPAVAKMVETLQASILADVRGEDEKQAVERLMAIASLAAKHKIGLCVTDQPAMQPVEGRRGGPPIPAAALLVDLGKDRQAMAEHVDALLNMLSRDTKTPIGTATAGEVAYKTFRPERDAPVFGLGYIGNTLFVTIGEELPSQLVSLAEAADHSLLNSAKFAAAYKDVAGDNEQAAVYVDITAATKLIQSLTGQSKSDAAEAKKIMAALGVDKITAIVSATRVVERGFYTKTRLLTPAPHRGALMPLAGPPLTDADLAIAPADTLALLTGKVDPTALFAEIKRMLNAIDPRTAADFDRGTGQIEQQLGISIEKDLLAHMGGQVSLVSAPSMGGFLTGTAAVVSVKNEVEFATSLQKIEGFARAAMTPPTPDGEDADSPDARRHRNRAPALRTTKVGKTTITYVQIPDDDVPFAPAWAHHEGKLIVAAWPQVVQAVIEGAGKNAPLSANPTFAAARKHITSRPNIVTYVNFPGVLRQAYGLPMIGWTALANMAQRGGVAVRPHWLPTLSSLEKHLWPTLSTVSADEAGITTEDYGSLPLGIAGMNPLSVAPLMFISTARPAHFVVATNARSAAQLQQLGTAIQVYRQDQGKTPPNLQALAKYAGNFNAYNSVTYIPLPDNAPGRLIQAYYAVPLPSGASPRLAALYVDGSVRTIRSDAAFRKLLAASQAAAK